MPLSKVNELMDIFISWGYIEVPRSLKFREEFREHAELLVLSALYHLGNGNLFRQCRSMCNISVSEIHLFFFDFLAAMVDMKDEYVFSPRNVAELRQMSKYYDNVGLPGCCGSMDVVHVKWSSCPTGDHNCAKGKAGYPTLIFQCITDYNPRVIGIYGPQFGTRNDKAIGKVDRGCTPEFSRAKKKKSFGSTYARQIRRAGRATSHFYPNLKIAEAAVLATQSHGVLTCACDCVAKNACLSLPAEIKPPQTTQNCRYDGKSSAAISGTDLTLRVGYFPRQPRRPVLPRRPPDSRSTSYPAGRTRWHLQTPVCHHRVTTEKKSNAAAPRTQHSCTWSSCQREQLRAQRY